MADNRPCRRDLLQWINVVSFAVDDVKLFWIPIPVIPRLSPFLRNVRNKETGH